MAAVDSFQLLYREIARSCNCYVETLALVGAFYTASKAVILMRDCYSLIRLHFIPRLVYPRDLVHRYGQWAIISGASEIIAKAYAEELAKNGVSVILISADVSSVSGAVKSISETHGVEAIPLEADFSHGPAVCKSIKEVIRDKDIGFVINCLDSSLDIPQDFLDLSESKVWDIINTSIAAATMITHLALAGMAERRRGAIINISSGGCFRPTHRKAALSASTAFLDHFSRALHYEYGHQGVFVQSLVPFRVAPHNDAANAGWLVPQPQVYARHALSTLGISHRTTGYWPHTIQLRLVQCMPEWIWVLGSRVMSRTA
ncbi:inactive hydroxysteroid dehydrogenase-like protein 1 [Electrophorus electricus]|uniref:Inactive hydroxysteroid dehydrogenase-like protein 1 n=1 Tax=Electrophorus electricus TaxID=8005 RepID=A0A4W4ERU4_ELEEL|nr:inactive hydroxysteroid dehydrogenase-like protein 1 [Electrophorus electricus]